MAKQPKKIERVKFFVVLLLFVKKDQLKSGVKENEKIKSKSITQKVTAENGIKAIDLVLDTLRARGINPDPKEYILFNQSAIPVSDTDICNFLNLVPDYVLPSNQ